MLPLETRFATEHARGSLIADHLAVLRQLNTAICAETQTHVLLTLAKTFGMHHARCCVVVAIPQAINLALRAVEGVKTARFLHDGFGAVFGHILVALKRG